ncbi:CYTH domain-containing protein [candidate division TA06 bacterium]|uniref:CYTH domain-containing protein n=1 Tax=candidate division TA06 bacterium TaxID=2250710 RepID=A0A523URN6_UNCT6|nr:MAG: CYTH domain-containing protein [candidate division TA06 bacterium]
MRREVERKFKITQYDPQRLRPGKRIEQGYLSFSPEVRVRIRGKEATLTVKGRGTIERQEFEYPIPISDAEKLLKMTDCQISKVRHEVERLEIDVFGGKLKGLVLAEAELKERADAVRKPMWLEWEEVTGDERYLNRNLARHGIPDE